MDLRDLFVAGSRTDLTFYGSAAQFENLLGGRISFGRFIPHGRWDVLYDLANHHTKGFPDDRNDLLQHRLRISGRRSFPGGFELSAYAEGALYDDEFSWTLGVNLQKRF